MGIHSRNANVLKSLSALAILMHVSEDGWGMRDWLIIRFDESQCFSGKLEGTVGLM
jgi:hypothetical protein